MSSSINNAVYKNIVIYMHAYIYIDMFAMTVISFILRSAQHWYSLSKTEAESEAMEFGEKSGLPVVAVCPSLVLGPILQSNVNASSLILLKLLKGI